MTNETPGRGRIYADDWEQASRNGDLVHAAEAGVLTRNDVAQLGDVLIGTAEGRQSERDITIFDSTGMAIQDLGLRSPRSRRRARPAETRHLAVVILLVRVLGFPYRCGLERDAFQRNYAIRKLLRRLLKAFQEAEVLLGGALH